MQAVSLENIGLQAEFNLISLNKTYNIKCKTDFTRDPMCAELFFLSIHSKFMMLLAYLLFILRMRAVSIHNKMISVMFNEIWSVLMFYLFLYIILGYIFQTFLKRFNQNIYLYCQQEVWHL